MKNNRHQKNNVSVSQPVHICVLLLTRIIVFCARGISSMFIHYSSAAGAHKFSFFSATEKPKCLVSAKMMVFYFVQGEMEDESLWSRVSC